MQKLKIVGNHIGNHRDVSSRAVEILSTADKIIYEHRSNIDRLLEQLEISTASELVSMADIDTDDQKSAIAQDLRDGKTVALISDAGYPTIADPGQGLISFLVDNGLDVDIIPGPSISSTALVSAGLKESFGDFVFQELFRYDIDGIKKMAKVLEPLPQTLVIVDFPNRFSESIDILRDILGNRNAAFSIEITMPGSKIIRGTLEDISHYINSDVYNDKSMSTLIIAGKDFISYS